MSGMRRQLAWRVAKMGRIPKEYMKNNHYQPTAKPVAS
jgi:hypothetical protein